MKILIKIFFPQSKQVWRCIHFMYCVIRFVYVTKQMQSVKIWFKIDNLHLIELQNIILTRLCKFHATKPVFDRAHPDVWPHGGKPFLLIFIFLQRLHMGLIIMPLRISIMIFGKTNDNDEIHNVCTLIHSQQNIKRRKVCDYRHYINFATFQSSYM